MRVERESAEREIEESERPERLAKKALSTGVSIAAGGLGLGSLGVGKNMIKRLLPFLNKALPEEIAVKGISKINGKFGKFIEEGIKKGLPASGAIEYLRNEAQNSPVAKKLEEFRAAASKDSPARAKLRKELGGEDRFIRHEMQKQQKQQNKQILQERSEAEKLERQKIQGANQGQPQGGGQAALMQILQQINQRLG
jgi:hypothetical protein